MVDELPPKKGLSIGTSGWSYEKDWKGIFYRPGTAMLKQYLTYFDTAEINSTFYALPKQSFIKYLSNSVSDTKFFTAKIPRKATHDGRLNLHDDVKETLDAFFELLEPIENKIACLLIQLPPWPMNKMGGLEEFFQALNSRHRYAIEFRHESWLQSSVYRLLEEHEIAYVIVDEPKLPIDLRVTTDFSYIRWHGHGKKPWYNYRYSPEELECWVPRIEEIQKQSDRILGYFNNHFSGFSPLNAFQMLKSLSMINPHQERKLDDMLSKMSVQQTSIDDFIN